MKREWKVAIAIVLTIIIFSIVDVGLFLYSGSEIAVWFLILGLPIVLVVGAIVYVRGALSGPTGGQSRFVREQARQTGEKFQEFWSSYSRLRDEYPTWEPKELEEGIDQILINLEDQGIAFNESSGSYSLSNLGSPDVEELDRIEGRIDQFRSRMISSFRTFVSEEIERLQNELGKLEAAGLVSETDWERIAEQADSDDKSVQNLVQHLEEFYSEVESILEQAIDTVTELKEDVSDVDENSVRERLESAHREINSQNYEDSIGAILRGHEIIESDVGSRSKNLRQAIDSQIETIENSIVDKYVSPELLDQVNQLRNDLPLEQSPSALEIEKLSSGADQLSSVSTQMIQEMVDELQGYLDTLESAELPPDFYDYPKTADENHVSTLRRSEPEVPAQSIEEITDSMKTYRMEWMESVGELGPAIENLSTKGTVAETYGEVSETIQDRLRSTGRVRSEDLPVRETEKFMEIYAADNPNVQFNSAVPELTLDSGGEQFDLTLLVEFETGGNEKSAKIQVEGPTDTWEETIKTRLAAEQSFSDLPYGEYTVRITPDSSSYQEIEREVMLDQDVSIEVKLDERCLQEILCEDIDVNIEKHLSELEGELEKRFADSGHVVSETDFGISEEYIPCIVATWAKQNDYATTTSDGSGNTLTDPSNIGEKGYLIAYDTGGLIEELQTVCDYNLESGEDLTFDALRDRYLTAPVPDADIIDAVREHINESGIRVTDTGIKKEG